RVTARPGGASTVISPAAAPGPQATVRHSPVGAATPPGASSVTRPGARCTATGRFPAGAGPLPCRQEPGDTRRGGPAPARRGGAGGGGVGGRRAAGGVAPLHFSCETAPLVPELSRFVQPVRVISREVAAGRVPRASWRRR